MFKALDFVALTCKPKYDPKLRLKFVEVGQQN